MKQNIIMLFQDKLEPSVNANKSFIKTPAKLNFMEEKDPHEHSAKGSESDINASLLCSWHQQNKKIKKTSKFHIKLCTTWMDGHCVTNGSFLVNLSKLRTFSVFFVVSIFYCCRCKIEWWSGEETPTLASVNCHAAYLKAKLFMLTLFPLRWNAKISAKSI